MTTSTDQTLYQSVTFLPNSTFYWLLRGFQRTFATGVACWQGTLPPDTWSCPIWDLDMFYLLRPIFFPNLFAFWMTVVAPTDRPKSVRNRCVIQVLVAFFCCPLVFEFSVGIGVFVIGLSQISFFMSLDRAETRFPTEVSVSFFHKIMLHDVFYTFSTKANKIHNRGSMLWYNILYTCILNTIHAIALFC